MDEEPLEMTCTMRHWDKASPKFLSRRSLASVSPHNTTNTGPELLLTPVQDMLPPTAVRTRSSQNIMSGAGNSASPLRRRSSFRTSGANGSSSSMRQLAPVSVIILPLADLVLADVQNSKREFAWTTGSHGSWRIEGLDQNAFDILLAFLRARMPPERIVYQVVADDDVQNPKTPRSRNSSSNNNNPHSIPQSSSSVASSSCLDVDMLTAAHLKGRASQETLSEKMSRRVSHVLAAISDWGNGLGLATLMEDIDTKCCSGNTVCCNNANGQQSVHGNAMSSPSQRRLGASVDATQHDTRLERNSPNRRQQQQVIRPFRYSDLEMDDNDSALSGGRASTALQMASMSQASSILEGEPIASPNVQQV